MCSAMSSVAAINQEEIDQRANVAAVVRAQKRPQPELAKRLHHAVAVVSPYYV